MPRRIKMSRKAKRKLSALGSAKDTVSSRRPGALKPMASTDACRHRAAGTHSLACSCLHPTSASPPRTSDWSAAVRAQDLTDPHGHTHTTGHRKALVVSAVGTVGVADG
jgi:hypothetical protein